VKQEEQQLEFQNKRRRFVHGICRFLGRKKAKSVRSHATLGLSFGPD
jgi:hypothetical protein